MNCRVLLMLVVTRCAFCARRAEPRANPNQPPQPNIEAPPPLPDRTLFDMLTDREVRDNGLTALLINDGNNLVQDIWHLEYNRAWAANPGNNSRKFTRIMHWRASGCSRDELIVSAHPWGQIGAQGNHYRLGDDNSIEMTTWECVFGDKQLGSKRRVMLFVGHVTNIDRNDPLELLTRNSRQRDLAQTIMLKTGVGQHAADALGSIIYGYLHQYADEKPIPEDCRIMTP